jgi:hypothetical protein
LQSVAISQITTEKYLFDSAYSHRFTINSNNGDLCSKLIAAELNIWLLTEVTQSLQSINSFGDLVALGESPPKFSFLEPMPDNELMTPQIFVELSKSPHNLDASRFS